jgi:hypothetical protein
MVADAAQSTLDAAEKLEAGDNGGALRYLGRSLSDVQSKRDESMRKFAALESERRAALSTIRDQVIEDAQAAWNSGQGFFAPVLFQPLVRTGVDWEGTLSDITAIGWRLDSWQVVGAAPEPFEATVTLIQSLFTR